VNLHIYCYVLSTIYLVGVLQTVSDRISLYSCHWYWTISCKTCSHRSIQNV